MKCRKAHVGALAARQWARRVMPTASHGQSGRRAMLSGAAAARNGSQPPTCCGRFRRVEADIDAIESVRGRSRSLLIAICRRRIILVQRAISSQLGRDSFHYYSPLSSSCLPSVDCRCHWRKFHRPRPICRHIASPRESEASRSTITIGASFATFRHAPTR